MTAQLDQSLILKVRRKTMRGALTPEQRIAINLFWRKNVRAVIIARAFGIAPNTIYYQCLTGDAESYNVSRKRGINAAKAVNRVIDQMGVDAAWAKYVTPKMIKDINAELQAEDDRRKP